MPASNVHSPIRRLAASVVMVIGMVVALVAIFADQLGIGGGKGFGYVQLIGLIVGIALILAGLATIVRAALAPDAEIPITRSPHFDGRPDSGLKPRQ